MDAPATMTDAYPRTDGRNDPGSLEEIFRALAPGVLGYLRAAGAVDPEDTAGEVFLAIAIGLHRFDGDDTALRRWVFTIAHHKLTDERRRAKRRHFLRRPFHTPVTYDDAPFDPTLAAALRTLTAEQLEVVTLRFVADLPLGTVAEITGRTLSAVKAMQHRALDSLARALSDR